MFSQNRKRRFTDSAVFRDIFNQVVRLCAEKGLVTGETTVSDGTFIPSNIANNSLFEVVQEVEKNAVRDLDTLDEELRQAPGFKEPAPIIEEKTTWESATDPEGGYIDQKRKKGFGYLSQMTTDTTHGIVLGVDCYPANERESSIILRHIEKIKTDTGVKINNLALDAGYDAGAVHRGLELLGITGYVSCIDFTHDILKREAKYLPDSDCFECFAGKRMNFIKIAYKKTT